MCAPIQIRPADFPAPRDRAAAEPAAEGRLRFWEVERFFKCPLVGMCLTLAEQKQLLKKAGFSKGKFGPFELHEALVASAESENRLSRRVDAMLERKFGAEAAALLPLDSPEFLTRFKTAFEEGDVAAALWAAAVHLQLPIRCRCEIFGMVHMAMHWTAEQRMKAKRTISLKEKKIADLQRKLQKAGLHRRTLVKENKRIETENEKLNASIQALTVQNARLLAAAEHQEVRSRSSELELENGRLKKELACRKEDLKTQKRRLLFFEKENGRLTAELARQQETNEHFQKEAREFVEETARLNRCDPGCPSFDLCRKRILIVGGITRMASLYRDLIEKSGGVFEYHDGYMKKGTRDLETRLRRADVVLCPVSCNSHAACSFVKTLAKKHNKPVHMLSSSSLNAVSQALCGADPYSAGIRNDMVPADQ